jgi:uncharacterized protein YndB with AHSA1/START domain
MTRLIFTDGYTEGYVPAPKYFMTGVVELSGAGAGTTRMVWSARHSTDDDAKAHLEMGYREGWKAAAQQLEAAAQRL